MSRLDKEPNWSTKSTKEKHPSPLLGDPHNHQANTYVEDPVQTLADPVIVALVSASTCEHCLIGLMGHVLLASSIKKKKY